MRLTSRLHGSVLLTTQYRRKEMADRVTALLLVVMKESYAHAGATGCFANAHAARLFCLTLTLTRL